MRVLFIGGTGNISNACTRLALQKGIEIIHLNRGNHPEKTPEGVRTLKGDGKNPSEVRVAVKGMKFDCVVQWLGYSPSQVEADIDIFGGNVGQYIFISSASAYLKPLPHPVVTESTRLGNPFWEYARNKIASEQLLEKAGAEKGFPWTVVRPSHTYDDGIIPTNFGMRDFTVPQRILDGREIIVHGDGQSLWTLTHSSDFAKGFVGLIGNPAAMGQAFHITTDEFMTWDALLLTLGQALGREPKMVHIPSEYIAAMNPEMGAPILGERRYTQMYDNSKIKRLVPGFRCDVNFTEGIRSSLAWFDAHPAAKVIDQKTEGEFNRILAKWHAAFPVSLA
ncbi:MAG: SDR family oxidoreductase [Treponemataceae bacterium]